MARLVLPETKTLALVEYQKPGEARQAFKTLAFKRFQTAPLFLEWAPKDIFSGAALAKDQARDHNIPIRPDEEGKRKSHQHFILPSSCLGVDLSFVGLLGLLLCLICSLCYLVSNKGIVFLSAYILAQFAFTYLRGLNQVSFALCSGTQETVGRAN